MQYEILREESWKDLQEVVNIKLKGGWKLQGGVSVTLSESDEYRYAIYAQAIVLEKK